jgi:hypothetical protein
VIYCPPPRVHYRLHQMPRSRPETPEQQAVHAAKNKERYWNIIATETPADKVQRLTLANNRNKAALLKRIANESPAQAVARKGSWNKSGRKIYWEKKSNESHEQYVARRTAKNTYQRNKMQTDPLFALKRRLRGRLYKYMKNSGCKKIGKTEELLGVSWEEAIEHLNNNPRGLKLGDGIEIDHIKPFAAFKNLTDPIEQQLVSNWRNLQLLTKEENSNKNSQHDHNVWASSEAGIRLLEFERELRAKAVDDH